MDDDILKNKIQAANREESNDTAYQNELSAWNATLADGLPEHTPNAETVEAMQDVENNRSLKPHDSADDLFSSWDAD